MIVCKKRAFFIEIHIAAQKCGDVFLLKRDGFFCKTIVFLGLKERARTEESVVLQFRKEIFFEKTWDFLKKCEKNP